jgi:hypothetical protein
MASIIKELSMPCAAERVWDAVRDIGKIHERFVPGLVTDTRLEAKDLRVVTFSTGLVAREQIISCDDNQRRLAYTVVGGSFQHHNASFQVFEQGKDRSRLVWTTDLLPDSLVGPIGELIEQGSAIIQKTFAR